MLRSLVAAVALVLSVLLPAQAAGGEGADTVTAFHQRLLETMRSAGGQGCAARAAQLAPAVDGAFDLPDLAQRVLRRRWSSLSEAERKDFLVVFRELVISTYASRFAGFNGERFETLDTVHQPDGTELVHARLKPARGDAVSFDYVLHIREGHWAIINIVADGVSDLALRSTQYEQIIKQKGFDGLLAELKAQTRAAGTCK